MLALSDIDIAGGGAGLLCGSLMATTADPICHRYCLDPPRAAIGSLMVTRLLWVQAIDPVPSKQGLPLSFLVLYLCLPLWLLLTRKKLIFQILEESDIFPGGLGRLVKQSTKRHESSPLKRFDSPASTAVSGNHL